MSNKTKEGIEVKVGQIWARDGWRVEVKDVKNKARIRVTIVAGAMLGGILTYSRKTLFADFKLIKDTDQ